MEKKIVLTGEFKSSRENLRRDMSKSVLNKFIKRLKRKK